MSDPARPPTPSTIDVAALERDAEEVRTRAVATGLLEGSAAAAALAAWKRAGPAHGFATDLVARGLVAAGDAARLGATAPPLVAGATFSGCVLEKQLGQGGMGVVWLARRADGAQVVVKFLAATHVGDAAWRTRFAREGLVAKEVEHPNVVRVFAVEVAGPRPHIVMELVPGEDLGDRLARDGRIPPAEAARMARDVALGLGAAHARGVVHRDVKPGNVRITPEGQVKLVDFGLARGVMVEDGVSIAGQVLGTPHYMPPEQWGDHRVDARGDVYSLGATLYHLVTGQVPFPGEKPMAVCRKVLEGDLPRPRALAPDVPEDLELAILRMMSRDRRLRPADGDAAAQLLDAALRGAPVPVPALVEAGGAGRRHALLPGTAFVIGRAEGCDVRLDDPSVAPQHARVELGKTGFRVADLGGGTTVGGLPVRASSLNAGDVLGVGAVRLTFQDGGVGAALATAPLSLVRLRVRAVPAAVEEALIAQGDRRAVVALLGRLPARAPAADAAAAAGTIRAVLGDGALAEAIHGEVEADARRRRGRAPELLFKLTHENLGHDEEAWLAWWEEAAAAFPPQVAAPAPAPRLALRVEDPGEGRRAGAPVPLGERLSMRLGRGADCDLLLGHASVSRHHATLLRLGRRLVVRDDGSRFGTTIGGALVRSAFVTEGDKLVLGRVSVVVERAEDDAPPRAADGAVLLEAAAFEALVARRHPSTAAALVRQAQAVERLAWVGALAAELCPSPARARALVEEVQRAITARAVEALRALPEVLPDGPGPRAGSAAWAEHVAGHREGLGPQVAPVGAPDAP